jgi:hypothetical protein
MRIVKWSTTFISSFAAIAVMLAAIGAATPLLAQCPTCVESDPARPNCCGANGHTSFFANAYPYTETILNKHDKDLTRDLCDPRHYDYDSIPEPMPTISGSTWVKIAEGCQKIGKINLSPNVPVNLLLRASANVSSSTAGTNLRYEVRLVVSRQTLQSLPDLPAADVLMSRTAIKRVNSSIPQQDTVEGTLRNVPAGDWRYSMWARMIDTGSITFHYNWISAQGVPAVYPGDTFDVSSVTIPAAETTSGGSVVPGPWLDVGSPIQITNELDLDLAINASLDILCSTGANAANTDADCTTSQDGTFLDVWFTVNQPFQPGITRTGAIGSQAGDTLPLTVTMYDHVAGVLAGTHTLQMKVRNRRASGVRLRSPHISYVSFPYAQQGFTNTALMPTVREFNIRPMNEISDVASEISPNFNTKLTRDECGLFAQILGPLSIDDLSPDNVENGGTYLLDAFVELKNPGVQGIYGEVFIEVQHTDPPDVMHPMGKIEDPIDAGRGPIRITPDWSGFYVHGDIGAWGLKRNNTYRLWFRQISCNVSFPDAPPYPTSNAIRIGRRWMSIKTLPTLTPAREKPEPKHRGVRGINTTSRESTADSGSEAMILVSTQDEFGMAESDYLGTVQFSSSDPSAVLPLPYTFTGDDAGHLYFKVTFNTPGQQTVTVTDAQLNLASTTTFTVTPARALPGVPTGLTAYYEPIPNRISVCWDAVQGTDSYTIYRSSTLNGFQAVGTTSSACWLDAGIMNGPPTPGSPAIAYLYKVTAVNTTGESGPSVIDFAVPVTFSETLVRDTSIVSASHINELRWAVDAVRSAAVIPRLWGTPATLTSVGSGDTAASTDISDLRNALDAARNALGRSNATYTYSISPNGNIHLEDIQELRDALR